jgi:multidrug efflux pump subunit AcrB
VNSAAEREKEAAKEVLRKVLSHLDLSRASVPSLLAAVGVGVPLQSQQQSQALPATSHNTVQQTQTQPSSSSLEQQQPQQQLMPRLVRKRRVGSQLREHGTQALLILRHFFAPYNRELAALTNDKAYLDWNAGTRG